MLPLSTARFCIEILYFVLKACDSPAQVGVVLINQGARGMLAHNGGGGGDATADDAALLGNRSAAAWANISSTPANITSEDGGEPPLSVSF